MKEIRANPAWKLPSKPDNVIGPGEVFNRYRVCAVALMNVRADHELSPKAQAMIVAEFNRFHSIMCNIGDKERKMYE
jgi:hypothetical protein